MKTEYEKLEINGFTVDKEEIRPEVMDGNPGFSFYGPHGGRTLRNAVILNAPVNKNRNHEILYLNVSRKEKEQLFDLLDAELHDTTWRQLDDENTHLKNRVDELEEELELYRERVVGY
jgi:hypothetical protein